MRDATRLRHARLARVYSQWERGWKSGEDNDGFTGVRLCRDCGEPDHVTHRCELSLTD